MTMRHYEHLAEQLTLLMEERGLSCAELARRTGIASTTLRRVRNGRHDTLSTRSLLALSNVFEIPLAGLIDRFS